MNPTPEFVGPPTPAQLTQQQAELAAALDFEKHEPSIDIPTDLGKTPDSLEFGYGDPHHLRDFDDPLEGYFAKGTTPIDKKYRLSDGPLTNPQAQIFGRGMRLRNFQEPPEIIQIDPATVRQKADFLGTLGLGVSATPTFEDLLKQYDNVAKQQPQIEGDK